MRSPRCSSPSLPVHVPAAACLGLLPLRPGWEHPGPDVFHQNPVDGLGPFLRVGIIVLEPFQDVLLHQERWSSGIRFQGCQFGFCLGVWSVNAALVWARPSGLQVTASQSQGRGLEGFPAGQLLVPQWTDHHAGMVEAPAFRSWLARPLALILPFGDLHHPKNVCPQGCRLRG